ncbi:MAG: hypothetical protein JJE52_15950, partial [Acidimicrobiia bacterium]|nr:hypothetical protein [Acidimicrobiia bacterium]
MSFSPFCEFEMPPLLGCSEVSDVVASVGREVARLQAVELDGLTAEEVLVVVRELEVVRRRLDHATDRLAGHVDRTGAYGVDGHRSAKAVLCHLGRLSGAD